MGRSGTMLRWGVAVVALVVATAVVATALIDRDAGAPAPIEVAAGTDVPVPTGELRQVEPVRVLAVGPDDASTGSGSSDGGAAAPSASTGEATDDGGTVAVEGVDGLVPTLPTLPPGPGGTVPAATDTLADLLAGLLPTTTTTSPSALPLPLPPLPVPVP